MANKKQQAEEKKKAEQEKKVMQVRKTLALNFYSTTDPSFLSSSERGAITDCVISFKRKGIL